MEKSNTLCNLLNKKMLTLDQLQIIQEDVLVSYVENCGNSGYYKGYIWYNVILFNGLEYTVYVK